ncbi:hypothetical protein P7C70_g697, partial [Phenoliferia sp. Uapishka_3]
MFILRTFLATSAVVAFVAAHRPGGSMEVHRNMGRQSIPIVPGILSLNPNILSGGGQVINLNVIAGLLGIATCKENQVVGLATTVNVLGLLTVKVCACVAIDADGTVKDGNHHICPACPANASRTCGTAGGVGNCGCTCDQGYYAYTDPTTKKQLCAPTTDCASPSTLIQLTNGRSSCVCARGFIDNLLGGCINACLVVNV